MRKAQATFIINTNAKHYNTKTFSRSASQKFTDPKLKRAERSNEMKVVSFQINSPYDLPQILHATNINEDMHSITFKAGHEYFIQV